MTDDRARRAEMVFEVACAICLTAGRNPLAEAGGEPPCKMWELEEEYAEAAIDAVLKVQERQRALQAQHA